MLISWDLRHPMVHSYDMRIEAAATPLPERFPDDEIGLMTYDEFLAFRNPDGKHHESDTYDFSLVKLNRDHAAPVGIARDRGETFEVSKAAEGYRIVDKQDKLVGLIHAGVGYYDNAQMKSRFPREVIAERGRDNERVDLGVTSTKHVKYLSEYVPLISPIAKLNQARYPVVLQHITVKGEPMVVRAEKKPVLNKRTSLAIFNHEGYVVAQGADEWGATLLVVAQEYRGSGLGKIIGRYWYEFNPASKSGGFTNAGEANAVALWKERVREFSANGWYSQLIREGRITYERVKAIVKDAKVRPPARQEVVAPKVKATGDILVFADGISFIVYDRAFLDEQEEKWIHGFGLFRDAEVGSFLFRIEYDRPFAELTTKIALQMARDNGEKLYDGGGYNDLLEDIEKYPGVEREGNLIVVTRDLVPLRAMAAKEKQQRKAVDPYDEKFYSLQELANSKWD